VLPSSGEGFVLTTVRLRLDVERALGATESPEADGASSQ